MTQLTLQWDGVSTTWVNALGLTRADKIQVWGAGSAGGYAGSRGYGGGESGYYVESSDVPLTLGATYDIVAGISGIVGAPGGDSSFAPHGGSPLLLAKGGGAASTSYNAGGSTSLLGECVGDLKRQAGHGGNGGGSRAGNGGGGGGAPDASGDGHDGSDGEIATAGGIGTTQGGAGGNGATTSTDATDGFAPGGGGGGGKDTRLSGLGAAGRIILTYTPVITGPSIVQRLGTTTILGS